MDLIFKLEKDITEEEVIAEVSNQINSIRNIELVNELNKYVVKPTLHLAIWDYSEQEAKYPAWLILKSENDDSGILYSEYGFGFGNWGLTTLSDHPFHFGPDYHWFSTLEEAFLNSRMSNSLD